MKGVLSGDWHGTEFQKDDLVYHMPLCAFVENKLSFGFMIRASFLQKLFGVGSEYEL